MLGIGMLLVLNPMTFGKKRRLFHMLTIIFIRMIVIGSILVILSMVIDLMVWDMHLFLFLYLVCVFFVID